MFMCVCVPQEGALAWDAQAEGRVRTITTHGTLDVMAARHPSPSNLRPPPRAAGSALFRVHDSPPSHDIEAHGAIDDARQLVHLHVLKLALQHCRARATTGKEFAEGWLE